MRGIVHHLDLTVRDPAESFAFYDAVLTFIGYHLWKQGDDGYDWVIEGRKSGIRSGCCGPRGTARKAHDRYSPGCTMSPGPPKAGTMSTGCIVNLSRSARRCSTRQPTTLSTMRVTAITRVLRRSGRSEARIRLYAPTVSNGFLPAPEEPCGSSSTSTALPRNCEAFSACRMSGDTGATAQRGRGADARRGQGARPGGDVEDLAARRDAGLRKVAGNLPRPDGRTGQETALMSGFAVKTVLLVRHGETEWNRARRYQGWLELAADPDGSRAGPGDRAASAASAGSGQRRDRRQPARPRPAHRRDHRRMPRRERGRPRPIRFDERLREISLGSWDGLDKRDIKRRAPELFAGEDSRWEWYFRSPDGETYDASPGASPPGSPISARLRSSRSATASSRGSCAASMPECRATRRCVSRCRRTGFSASPAAPSQEIAA